MCHNSKQQEQKNNNQASYNMLQFTEFMNAK